MSGDGGERGRRKKRKKTKKKRRKEGNERAKVERKKEKIFLTDPIDVVRARGLYRDPQRAGEGPWPSELVE